MDPYGPMLHQLLYLLESHAHMYLYVYGCVIIAILFWFQSNVGEEGEDPLFLPDIWSP